MPHSERTGEDDTRFYLFASMIEWRLILSGQRGYFIVHGSVRFLGRSIPVSACDLPYRKRSQGWQGSTSRHMRGADHATVAVRASVVAAQRITSSARKRTVGGIVRPSALAVLRLMTNSNLVGCSTGRSAGLAPFKILST